MSIWSRLFGPIVGGWKTYGPNQISGPGAFDLPDGDNFNVSVQEALRLPAVWQCLNIRAETIGTLPLHLRDDKKNIVRDHPLYNVLHRSPNADMTAAEYWSLVTAQVDMLGNAVSIIERGMQKKVIALVPVVDPDACQFQYNKSGSRKTWKIGADEHSDDDILHMRGFTMNGGWGEGRLSAGRAILAAQLSANRSAMRAFRQGLKIGGFLLNERQADLTNEQVQDLKKTLSEYAKPENAGRWLTLLRGLKPIAGTDFAVKPADAQLLESRYFGIEEICRLFGVPPPLVGHTSKSSTWPSSLELLNLHLATYSLQPTIVRYEQRIDKKLLTPTELAQGLEAKYSMQALLRGDTKTRQAFYASALQNGYYSRDEVRDLEDRGKIPGGDKYTVQMNMADVTDLDNSDGTGNNGNNGNKPKDEGDAQ